MGSTEPAQRVHAGSYTTDYTVMDLEGNADGPEIEVRNLNTFEAGISQASLPTSLSAVTTVITPRSWLHM